MQRSARPLIQILTLPSAKTSLPHLFPLSLAHVNFAGVATCLVYTPAANDLDGKIIKVSARLPRTPPPGERNRARKCASSAPRDSASPRSDADVEIHELGNSRTLPPKQSELRSNPYPRTNNGGSLPPATFIHPAISGERFRPVAVTPRPLRARK